MMKINNFGILMCWKIIIFLFLEFKLIKFVQLLSYFSTVQKIFNLEIIKSFQALFYHFQ